MGHQIMDFLIPAFDIVVVALNFLSIIVLIWGVVISGYDFIRSELLHEDRVRQRRHNNLSATFEAHPLSLEILIAADMSRSIINPPWRISCA